MPSSSPAADPAAVTRIAPLTATAEVLRSLAGLLIETIADGASVTFMHPLGEADAREFWEASLAAAARGERIVFGAFDGEALVGTVTLVLRCPPNQPHRAEIAKLMTRASHRRRGIGSALMRAAEAAAAAHGKTLIVLDTAADGGAATLYEALGYSLAGIIPDYSFKPHGGLTATRIYWKRPSSSPGA
jgi:ribosomal protein S18 acetylase RimI-like enzyme